MARAVPTSNPAPNIVSNFNFSCKKNNKPKNENLKQAKQQQKIVRNKDDGILFDDAAPQCQIHNC